MAAEGKYGVIIINGLFQDMAACSAMEVANLILRSFGKPGIEIKH